MLGRDDTALVAAGDEHQGAVVFVHIVQKNRHVHGALGGHHVVVQPSAVVLVPLPDVAFKSHLAVDLELVHVQLFTQQHFYRFDHARMAAQLAKRLAHHVRRKIGAHCIAAFFAHIESIPFGVELGHGVQQGLGFLRRKLTREKEITVTVELG